MAENAARLERLEQSYALYQRGRAALDAGDHAAAADLLRQSAEASPHFKTLELWGECLLQLNHASEALIPLAAAVGIGIDSKPFRALFLLAQAMDLTGDRRRAVQYLDRAIEMKPDFKSARDLRAKLMPPELK